MLYPGFIHTAQGDGRAPVKGFLGGAQIILSLLQLTHPALPSLLLLYAGLVGPVRIPGQSPGCIHLRNVSDGIKAGSVRLSQPHSSDINLEGSL